MKKPCDDCPFITSSPLEGSPEWLEDVLVNHAKDEFFRHTCHKTDPKADGYKGSRKVRYCSGHISVMMNSLDNTPGLGGVYDSVEQMAKTYIEHWGVKLPPSARLRSSERIL